MCVCVSEKMCVSVCVRERRGREKEINGTKERGRDRDRDRDRDNYSCSRLFLFLFFFFPQIDPSQELIAIGASNIMSSLVGGYPSTGSFSRTAVNAQSGVKTPLGGVFTGIVVLLSLLFMSGKLSFDSVYTQPGKI